LFQQHFRDLRRHVRSKKASSDEKGQGQDVDEGGDHGVGAVCGDGWKAKEWGQKNPRTILLPPFFCLRFPARLIHEGSIQGGIDRRMGTRE
jgi:hypothetical protein